ncbi:MAG: hypothetical protein JW969_20690 [Spirochaetales bacterium]|nr:hypothetical protein [Spirochaetales bacterium]
MIDIKTENDHFQVLSALKHNRHKRNELKEVFVEGVAGINAALANGLTVKRVVFPAGRNLSDWAGNIIKGLTGGRSYRLAPRLMAALSDKSDVSELIITCEKPEIHYASLEFDGDPLVAVLDRPGNPGNLGSIIRSADAFGADAVITLGHGIDPYDPAVIRASLGAVFAGRTFHEPSSVKLTEWLSSLKTRYADMLVAGTDSDAERGIDDRVLRKPLVLIFGNEAKGVSVRLKEFADRMIGIPMQGAVNSLNVACAASIFLYQAVRNSH